MIGTNQLLDLDPAGEAGRRIRDYGPSASLNFGGAGVALALCRAAVLTGDPRLLARARLWSAWARRQGDDASRWSLRDLGVADERVWTGSLLHSIAGLYFVEALVAHTDGDAAAVDAAVGELVAHARRHGGSLHDATVGDASLLAGCSALVELTAGRDGALGRLGDDLARGLLGRLPAETRAGDPSDDSALGFAHGRWGVLHALVRWSLASGTPVPALVQGHARALLDRATSGQDDSGPAVDDLAASWCHGLSGRLLLWAVVVEATGEGRFVDAAATAGEALWARCDDDLHVSLCCGAAGVALAFGVIHRLGAPGDWIARGEAVIARTPRDDDADDCMSLFKGQLGLDLAALELRGGAARFPIYEGLGLARPRRDQPERHSAATDERTS